MLPQATRLLLRTLILIGLTSVFYNASAAEPIRVGLLARDPFVIQKGDVWDGYCVELWQQIATLNNWTWEPKAYSNTESALDGIAKGECDVLVGDISITSDRLKTVDFSQPFFHTGLQIMIPEARPHTFKHMMADTLALVDVSVFWIAALVILIFTLFVTLFERTHNPDFPKSWSEGYAESFYYVISLALTGKSVYKGFPGILGRLVMVVWMILGIVMVAYVTSSITSTMTVERLQRHINGPQDLPGKTIGVIENTTSAEYATAHQIEHISYPDIPSAVTALLKHDIQAIVADAPVLQYYDNMHPELSITEVGPLFATQTYGFAFGKNTELRVSVNRSLLHIAEDGDLLHLGQKYFGNTFHP